MGKIRIVLFLMANELVKAGITTQKELDAIQADIVELMKYAMTLAIDEKVSPRMDLEKHPELIGDMIFSKPKC